MTTTIYYTPIMKFAGTQFHSCNTSAFVERIKNNLPSFEVTPNDIPIKYYFDVDVKNISFNNITATAIEGICKQHIHQALLEYSGIEPNIAIATSHCNNKYSFRYYVSNMLDKKSNMIQFVKLLNQYIIMKKDLYIDNIYDYIEETNTPIFDEAVYDSNRKMRCLNTSKDGENRPLVLKEGTIENTIISGYFDNDAKVINFQSSPVTVSYNFEPINYTGKKDDKYIELLFDIIGNGSYIDFNTWFHIASVLKCNNYPFELLETYTSIVDKANPVTERIWNSIDKNKPFSIYVLESIAKKLNKDKYLEWKQKHNDIITIDILTNGSNDICKFISKSLKETLIYCKNTWLT